MKYFRFLILIFSMVSICCLVSCGDDGDGISIDNKNGICGNTVEWTYNGQTHELSIVGKDEMTNYHNTSSTPWYGLPIHSVKINSGITSVGSNAFNSCSDLSVVDLPSTLKIIHKDAFSNTGINNVKIPESVTEIQEWAFANCTSLTTINFASNCKLEEIGKQAFYNTSIQALIIPTSVKTIGYGAFMSTKKLNNIDFNINNSQLETIEDNAFRDCGLNNASLTFGAKLKKIGNYAFMGCTVKKVTFGTALNTIGSQAFEGVSEDVTLPNSLTNLNQKSISGSFKVLHIGYCQPNYISTWQIFESTANSGKVYVNCALPPTTYGSYDSSTPFSKIFASDVSNWTLYVPKGCKERYPYSGFGSVVESSSLDNGNSLYSTSIPGSAGNAVDLGLSVKWADRNVGATSIGDYGGLYGWGDGSGGRTSEDENEYYAGYEEYDICGSIRDIAAMKWGGKWRIPTEEELWELHNCNSEIATINGVDGIRIIGPNGNSIFLPAAGYRIGTEIFERGSYGAYWGGTSRDRMNYADDMYFKSNSKYMYIPSWHKLYYGESVRPVTD